MECEHTDCRRWGTGLCMEAACPRHPSRKELCPLTPEAGGGFRGVRVVAIPDDARFDRAPVIV